jgi:hypothetical protein
VEILIKVEGSEVDKALVADLTIKVEVINKTTVQVALEEALVKTAAVTVEVKAETKEALEVVVEATMDLVVVVEVATVKTLEILVGQVVIVLEVEEIAVEDKEEMDKTLEVIKEVGATVEVTMTVVNPNQDMVVVRDIQAMVTVMEAVEVENTKDMVKEDMGAVEVITAMADTKAIVTLHSLIPCPTIHS